MRRRLRLNGLQGQLTPVCRDHGRWMGLGPNRRGRGRSAPGFAGTPARQTMLTRAMPTTQNPRSAAKFRRDHAHAWIPTIGMAVESQRKQVFGPRFFKGLKSACFPARCAIKPRPEMWPSGRRHTPAKGAGGKPPRGFESLRLRHLSCLSD